MIAYRFEILFYLHRYLNEISIKYQTHPKSWKIDAFEKIYAYAITLLINKYI